MALYINFIPPFCWYEMNEFLSDAISLKVRQYPKIAVHALAKAYGVASQMVVIVQHRLPSLFFVDHADKCLDERQCVCKAFLMMFPFRATTLRTVRK